MEHVLLGWLACFWGCWLGMYIYILVQNLRTAESLAPKEGNLAPVGNFAKRGNPVCDGQVAKNSDTLCGAVDEPSSIFGELDELEALSFDGVHSLVNRILDTDEDSV